MQSDHMYVLKGDVRALSNSRITARRILSNLQQQSIYFTIELERQHNERKLYGGPLHLDLEVYFISELPVYKQSKITNCRNRDYNMANPYISTLIALIEKVGEGVLFESGYSISSVNCVKENIKADDAFIAFSIKELRK
jgi:hypothetical protein